MAAPDPVLVIQATLSPIFLVSGSSIFLNFLQTRLFRVHDRLRQLAKDLDGIPAGLPRRAVVERGVATLRRRVHVVRNAIVLGVVAVLLTMLTTLLLIVPSLLRVDVRGELTVSVFALGLAAFAAALLLALQDTLLSVRMVEAEVRR